MTTFVGICMEKKVVMFETLRPTVCIKKPLVTNNLENFMLVKMRRKYTLTIRLLGMILVTMT